MKYRDFEIEIEGRKNGTYRFSYELSDDFFELFENSLLDKGSLSVELKMIKKNKLYEFIYHIEGEIELICDRCLGKFMQPVEVDAMQIVKVGDEYKEVDERTVMIPEAQKSINVAQWIYEDVALTVPLRKVHPDDENGNSTCDKEMLDILEKYSINEKEDTKIDPRWGALKDLMK
jgi:uncharacterized protein